MTYFSDDRLAKIRWLLQDCGKQAREMSSHSFEVYEKGVNDYVTDVDRALDERLFAGFSALYPNDGIITEENAESRKTFHQGCDRLWLIDPLDGTEDFIRGKSHFATMVGLLESYEPIAGWVYAPVFDQLYYGGVGLGLFQATGDRPAEPLIPKEPAPPSENCCPIIIGDKDRRQYGEAIARLVPGVQFNTLGSFGLKVMSVILGQAGLYVYFNRRVKLWDTTGPLALAKAAGLICCDLEGEPIRFTPDAIEPDSLAHEQTIVIGWKSYVEALRSPIRKAVNSVGLS